ncbi:MAG: hypothetical protein U1E26_03885 [Coriobacteriia bacterium]|nr:hypothetical protein [Coriobacteriia bacterium]
MLHRYLGRTLALAMLVALVVSPTVAGAVSPPGKGKEIKSLAVSPAFATDKTIFVGGQYDATFWKSTNGGSSFSLIAGAPQDIEDIAVSPAYATDRTLFVASRGNRFGVGAAIYRSVDGGATWTKLSTGLPFDGQPYRLRISPGFAADRTIVAMVNTNLYKSADAGESWTLITPSGAYGELAMDNFAMSPGFATDGGLVAVEGFRDTIRVSTTGGSAWSPAAVSPSWNQGFNDACYSSDFANDHTVFATHGNGHIFRSTDGGAQFTRIAEGFGVIPARSIVTSPRFAIDNTVLAGGARSVSAGIDPGPLFGRSTDRGVTWVRAETGLTGSWIEDIDYSPNFANDNTVFVVTGGSYTGGEGGAFVSRNGGLTWARLGGTIAKLGTPSLSPSSPRKKARFYVSGTLPAHVYSTSVALKFYLRNSKGKYVYKTGTNVGVLGGVGTYRKAVTLPTAGKWYVRSYHADLGHDPSWSSIRYFTVRN